MVAVEAVSAVSSAPARRRGLARLRLPEMLACAGAAMAGAWPGTPLSSTHLIMVSACFVPLGVRTLLRLENDLVVLPPAAFHTSLGRTDYRTAFHHVRTALALIDLDRDGTATIHRANPAFRELAGITAPEPGPLDPHRLFTADGARALDGALRLLSTGTASTWDGVVTAAAAGADQAGLLRVGLVRLPTEDGVRIGMSLVHLDPPPPPPPTPAPEVPLPRAEQAGEPVPEPEDQALESLPRAG